MTRVFLGIFIPTLTVINSRREERSFPSAFHIDSPVWSDSSNVFFPFPPLSLLVHPAYVPIKSFARLGHAIPRFRSLSSQFALSLSLSFFVTMPYSNTTSWSNLPLSIERIFFPSSEFLTLNRHNPLILFSLRVQERFTISLVFFISSKGYEV